MKQIIAIGVFIPLALTAVYLYTNKSTTVNNKPISVSDKMTEALTRQNLITPSVPIYAEGYDIGEYMDDLTGVRDLEFNVDGILIATLMNRGEVVAIPDNNNDGVGDSKIILISNLQKPHGIAIRGDKLFVAEETRVSRYSFNSSTLQVRFEKKLFDLPKGGRHTTRSLVFDNKGNLYISLGSTCDTCIEKEPFISTVLVSDAEGITPRIFSKGLRNAVFLALKPGSNEIWVTEMGRDFLGDTTPPDEINVLNDGGNFGWPFCYGQGLIDKTQKTPSLSFCKDTTYPYYEIPAHSAPLGLTFINSEQMPKTWQGDLLVAYHGSWNRSTPSGYKVVRISTKGTPTETDFMTGFSNTTARPVDVIFDKQGSLFVSDDKSGTIYKVIKKHN